MWFPNYRISNRFNVTDIFSYEKGDQLEDYLRATLSDDEENRDYDLWYSKQDGLVTDIFDDMTQDLYDKIEKVVVTYYDLI